jgi:hypothetical protein
MDLLAKTTAGLSFVNHPWTSELRPSWTPSLHQVVVVGSLSWLEGRRHLFAQGGEGADSQMRLSSGRDCLTYRGWNKSPSVWCCSVSQMLVTEPNSFHNDHFFFSFLVNTRLPHRHFWPILHLVYWQ